MCLKFRNVIYDIIYIYVYTDMGVWKIHIMEIRDIQPHYTTLMFYTIHHAYRKTTL